jgi:hypothetical protein
LGVNLERGVNATVDPRGVDADATDPTSPDEPFGGLTSDAREMQRTVAAASQVGGGVGAAASPASVDHYRRVRFDLSVRSLISLKVGDGQAVVGTIGGPVPHVDDGERADQVLGWDLVRCCRSGCEVRRRVHVRARMLAERYDSAEGSVVAVAVRGVEDRRSAAGPHHRSWPERLCQVDDKHGRRI